MARPAISDERVIIEGPQSIRVKLKSRLADGTGSLLFTPSEFLERLVALIPALKFHTTRYYGILASRSMHRRYLPDRRKRIFWAQLLTRTFKIGVLKCDKCGGRMKLVGVVFDQPTITATLRALVLPVRAPPIAQARSGSCLIATITTIGREQMSTPGGRTNEGPVSHPKNLKTPQLGSVIETGRGRRAFAVFTPFISD